MGRDRIALISSSTQSNPQQQSLLLNPQRPTRTLCPVLTVMQNNQIHELNPAVLASGMAAVPVSREETMEDGG